MAVSGKVRTVGMVVARQSRAAEMARTLERHLVRQGVRVLKQGRAPLPSVFSRSAFVAVLGGDGTLLRAAAMAAPTRTPLLGINLGRLGYVTPVAAEDMIKAVDLALRQRLSRDRRVMLQAQVLRKGRVAASALALNDVVVTKGAMGRIVELEVRVDGQYLTSYRADGLIMATPTGSTAYALSAGGPILHPRLKNLVLAPISPHTLSNRPLVLSDSSSLEVAIPEGGGDILVTADGRPGFRLKAGDRVVVRKAPQTTTLLVLPSTPYWEVLRSKLGWKGN